MTSQLLHYYLKRGDFGTLFCDDTIVRDATGQGQRSVANVLIGRASYDVTSSSVNTIVGRVRVSNPNSVVCSEP